MILRGSSERSRSRARGRIVLLQHRTLPVQAGLQQRRLLAQRFDEAGQIGVDPVTGNLYVAEWHGATLWKVNPDASLVLDSYLFDSSVTSLWSVRVAPVSPQARAGDHRLIELFFRG